MDVFEMKFAKVFPLLIAKADLSDMYDDYIYGLKELTDINSEFRCALH